MELASCIVEIDESKFGKRKYNRRRLRDGKWVLGGIERGSDNIFMRVVHTRDAATSARLRPGSDNGRGSSGLIEFMNMFLW